MPLRIAYVLGPLETAVMTVLWRATGPLKGSEVHLALQERALAYKTVLTIMNRLCDKGILYRTAFTRGTHGLSYQYTAAVSRSQVLAAAIDQLCTQIGADQADWAEALAVILNDGNLSRPAIFGGSD